MTAHIRNLTRSVMVLLALQWVAAETLQAKPVLLPNTEIRQLHSDVNGVDYKLYIALPEGYGITGDRYRVLYLLDADYSFAIARNVVEHLSQRDHLQPLILVAVAYDGPLRYRMNRTRDYTPTHTLEGGYGPKYQKVSGGGEKFLAFLSEELIPFIDREYRTIEGERGLTGHSYGGLFASWVFLTQPDLFDRYIIVSPSLWYDDEMIFTLENELREHRKNDTLGRTKIYLSVGSNENSRMPAGLVRFEKRLKRWNEPNLEIRGEVMEGETHNSIFPTAFSRGLRWAFDGR